MDNNRKERERLRKVLLLVVLFLTLSIGLNSLTTNAAIADGTHNLTYQVNKPDSNSASMANDYFLKPAKLIVSNGTMKVQLTIKNSSWVTEFNPPGGATVISSNASADQRVVQFNVSNLNTLKVAMKIDINDIDYHHSYTVDFVFKSDGLPEKQAVTEKSSATSNAGSQSSSNKSLGQASSKPSASTNSNHSANASESQNSNALQSNQASQTDVNKNGDPASENDDENSETENLDPSSTEEEVEANPETSDEFPYYALILGLVSIALLVCNKKLT